MVSTQSVREQLERYASGSMSAEAIEEWLMAETWDMRRWASPGLQRMIQVVQTAFIDNHDGRLSDENLNVLLLQKVEQLREAAKRSLSDAEIAASIQKPGVSIHFHSEQESEPPKSPPLTLVTA